jgi:alkylation response protein AidB-like acyl-CoA dehydrogenase
MDLAFTAEDLAFQRRIRAGLAEQLPPDIRRKVEMGYDLKRDDLVRWHKILYRLGWVAPTWPKEYGGPGWTATQRYLFDEEIGLASAPRLITFGLNMCAPVLMAFGNEQQKQKWLPRMLAAEDIWCQGYSEPGAGSDLASLKTRAVRDGDHYTVNGTKIWTTSAHMANMVFLLVRTSEGTKKQEGISFLLVDLKTPGITIRPIHLLDGLHETNQVFYENVRVPVENLVGTEGKGWTIAKYLLAHERMGGGALGAHKTLLAKLKLLAADSEIADGRPLIDDPDFRRKLSRTELELRTLEMFTMKTLAAVSADKPLGAEANILKIRQTEIHQALTELRMDAVGYYANPYVLGALLDGWNEESVGPEHANSATPKYMHFRKVSIYSGSNEIQHNIIAKGVLGL